MTVIYRDEDGDVAQLSSKVVGVIGYGSLGRAVALNLRDSGVQVLVSDRDAQRRMLAETEGFATLETSENVKRATVIMLLVANEVMPQIYLDQISPYLEGGDMLVFASAYNVTFGYIEAPTFVDVGLIAPRTLSVSVRERFRSGDGFISFVAVGQDASGQAWPCVLALARAVGALRAGAVEIVFEREAELELFVQQAIMPAFHHIMTTAAQLLMDTGYPPEAVFTDLYLSGEFSDYLERAAQIGLLPALRLSALTAQYGTLSRLDRFIDLKLQRLMEVTLDEIREGSFAREWAKEYGDGYHRLARLLRSQEQLDLWDWEQQTIDLLYPDRDQNMTAD